MSVSSLRPGRGDELGRGVQVTICGISWDGLPLVAAVSACAQIVNKIFVTEYFVAVFMMVILPEYLLTLGACCHDQWDVSLRPSTCWAWCDGDGRPDVCCLEYQLWCTDVLGFNYHLPENYFSASEHAQSHIPTYHTSRSTTIVLNPFELLHPCRPLGPQRHKHSNRFHLHVSRHHCICKIWVTRYKSLTSSQRDEVSAVVLFFNRHMWESRIDLFLHNTSSSIWCTRTYFNTKSWVFCLWGSHDCLKLVWNTTKSGL